MQEVPIQELELEDRFSTHLDTEAEQDLFLANRGNKKINEAVGQGLVVEVLDQEVE